MPNDSDKKDVIKNVLPATDLRTDDFDYELPEELIAQHPAEKRDCSRLLVADRRTGKTEDRIFHDIKDYLNPGDVLVINDSKVIPARLFGKKKENGTDIELLLLRQIAGTQWEVLARPGKKAKIGTEFIFGDKEQLKATVTGVTEDGDRIVDFDFDRNEYENIYALLDIIGNMPLPPYITEKLRDKNRYQTVYAKTEGSAAAPTAGLHFTKELLRELEEKGVVIAPVMLHVGLGTFRPVKADRLSDHIMHSEFFTVSKETADKINNRSGRLIAVGTTSCRVLESASDENGVISPTDGANTGIFIYPGYKFKAVQALITNFHLPKSTLIMLVSAFWDRENVLRIYKEAVEKKYRFFSFGDAMFIK